MLVALHHSSIPIDSSAQGKGQSSPTVASLKVGSSARTSWFWWPESIVFDNGVTWSTADFVGQILTATAPNSALVGTLGPDTLTASGVGDTLTGGAGADVFVVTAVPSSPIRIADFAVGVDKLDLSALFRAAGYSRTDPLVDGYVVVQGDGQGGALLQFDADGTAGGVSGPIPIIDLAGDAPSQIVAADWITA
jgi:Ca2+-binding RTX toxin-like protein